MPILVIHDFCLLFPRRTSIASRRLVSPRGGLTVISGGGSTENNSQTSTPNTENNNMKTQADVAADKIIHPPNMPPLSKCTNGLRPA